MFDLAYLVEQLRRCGRHGAVVDRAVGGGDDEQHVGLGVVEVGLEQTRSLGALGARVDEAFVLEHTERPGAEYAGGDHEEHGQ